MKEALWGYLILILGIFVVVVLLLTQNYSTTDEENYYLVKEAMEAAMLESVDLGTYRKDGTIRIVSEKFVENFTRRFAQSIKGSKTYKLDFYEIYESPPKATVKVSTSTGKYTIGEETASFEVITTLSGILEAKTHLKTNIELDNNLITDGNDVQSTTYYEDGILKTTYYEDDIETTIYNQGSSQITQYCNVSTGYCYSTSKSTSSSSSSGTGSSSGSTAGGNVSLFGNIYGLDGSQTVSDFLNSISCSAIKSENGHTYFYRCDAPPSSNLAYYLLYVPSTLKANMPVIVWLHGSGEVNKSPSLYTDMNYTRYFSTILYSNKINAFAILPVLKQVETPTVYREWARENTVAGIKTIVNQYKSSPLSVLMNFNKVSLAGHSLGGNGVIEIGATKNSDRFFYRLLALSTRMGSKEDESFDNGYADQISKSGVPIMIYTESFYYNVNIAKISANCTSDTPEASIVEKTDHADMPKGVFANEKTYHAISWLLGNTLEKVEKEVVEKEVVEKEPIIDTKPLFLNSCNNTNKPAWSTSCGNCKEAYFSGNYNFAKYTSSINGKTFTIFKQDFGPWKATTSYNGCYATSLSTIISGFYSDATLCDFMYAAGGSTPLQDFKYAGVRGGVIGKVGNFSATKEIKANNTKIVRDYLKKGYMLIFEMQGGQNICGNTGQHHTPILDYFGLNDSVFIGDTTTNSKCYGTRLLTDALKGVVTVYYIEP